MKFDKPMKKIAAALILFSSVFCAAAQENDRSEVEKSGFSFGAFPILNYERESGVQLGAFANVYDFGKKGAYPNPRQQIYAEASWFTRGSQRYVLSYDNRFLIPGIRFTFTARYSDEKALDFYGFGGYASYLDNQLPAAYYRMGRMMPSGRLDFTGRITDRLSWKFGYHFNYFILNEYESEKLAGLPYGKTLFAWYKDLGFIEADEAKGGMTSAWRAGLSYDSRDAESMPSRGLWADAFLEWAPKWMGTNKPYGRYYAVLRQYFPLAGDELVFAYRANIQGFLGKPGFYALACEPVLGGPGYDRDGFGGYHTIRGLLRNRVQGQALCYFNTELRWKFYSTRVLNQNVAFGANVFFDGGRVLKDYVDVHVDPTWTATWPDKFPSQLSAGGKEHFHLSAGAGLRCILNRNFIIAVDYGQAFNRQDNRPGGALYINTGFLF